MDVAPSRGPQRVGKGYIAMPPGGGIHAIKISANLTQDLVGLTEPAVLSLQGLELGGHVRGQARLAPAVSLGPANPLMQRLRRAADLRGNRSHRRPPRGMILLVLETQPNRKRAHFRRKSVRCLACHRSTFSRLGASGKPGAGLLRKRRRVKERLHRRFAEAPSSLVRPFLIVTLDPAIKIDLEIGDRAVDLLAKGRPAGVDVKMSSQIARDVRCATCCSPCDQSQRLS